MNEPFDTPPLPLHGAVRVGEGTRFQIWAPSFSSVSLVPALKQRSPIPLEPLGDGWHGVTLSGVEEGFRYKFLGDEKILLPDPASRFQPEGVEGDSEVVAPENFSWTDGEWSGRPLEEYVFYEVHTGLFSPSGRFEGIIEALPSLADIGVTAVEVMPIAAFPGERNWGYDGVFPYAVQASYGGPRGFAALADACHAHGLCLVLDVVYNHLGPMGNVLPLCAPYFTDRYRTPWGHAINFDGPGSDAVRAYFIENALMWLRDYHVDALRLDAVHAIFDRSAYPFLEELAERFHSEADRLGRKAYLIAESDRNDPRVIRPSSKGGYGLDAQWNDDFHHSLRTYLTGDRSGYFQDFGSLQELAQALSEGYVFTGQYSRYRGRRHGRSPGDCSGKRFVIFTQNHDQVANASGGRREVELLEPALLRCSTVILLTAPYLPMLFMGQEYGERAPFHYFVDYPDAALLERIRIGRAREYAGLFREAPPDPSDPETFALCRLDRSASLRPPGAHHRNLVRDLLRLRRRIPVLASCDRRRCTVIGDEDESWCLVLLGDRETGFAVTAANFSEKEGILPWPRLPGRWEPVLCSEEERYGGSGWIPEGPFRIRFPETAEREKEVSLAPRTAVIYIQRNSGEGEIA
ncbi:MAG: malto-oligosyltrehalose trehalohydrolase [Candidatus Hydrogenedentota bacterium]|nr:MAG: malto-oligosyltrehalose trehalohydrolase [Candidatus Hydrogenedentota bacterium]